MRLKFKGEADGNSGVFVHSRITGIDPQHGPDIEGMQVEVDPSKGKHTGGLYRKRRTRLGRDAYRRIKAWFDVGNVVLYGFPQDWIHTLGKRMVKVHLKDFKRKEDGYAWVKLGDGDVDWGAVRQAFADVGYSGSVIAEL